MLLPPAGVGALLGAASPQNTCKISRVGLETGAWEAGGTSGTWQREPPRHAQASHLLPHLPSVSWPLLLPFLLPSCPWSVPCAIPTAFAPLSPTIPATFGALQPLWSISPLASHQPPSSPQPFVSLLSSPPFPLRAPYSHFTAPFGPNSHTSLLHPSPHAPHLSSLPLPDPQPPEHQP